ncbi:MAG: hypothetical protein ACE1ZQ_09385 [Ignavibacteriaceae bacterium]
MIRRKKIENKIPFVYCKLSMVENTAYKVIDFGNDDKHLKVIKIKYKIDVEKHKEVGNPFDIEYPCDRLNFSILKN